MYLLEPVIAFIIAAFDWVVVSVTTLSIISQRFIEAMPDELLVSWLVILSIIVHLCSKKVKALRRVEHVHRIRLRKLESQHEQDSKRLKKAEREIEVIKAELELDDEDIRELIESHPHDST